MSSRRPFRGHGDGERGSISVELAILTPIFALLLLSVVAVGRIQNSRADIESAARSAARDLSIARDPTAAIGRVRAAISQMVNVGSPGCQTLTFTPTITPETVMVVIGCVADLQDASILPLPGHMTLTATATEAIDRFREVTP
jgi:Flp pilus assembly protein TadG